MSLRPTIHMTQTQKLVMTPKLQQAIKILQMPRLELNQYLSQQLVENPILEESYDEPEEGVTDNETEDEIAESEDDLAEADIDLDTGLPDEVEVTTEADSPELDPIDADFGDVDWEQYFDDRPPNDNLWEAPLEDDNRDTLSNGGESLEEHLLWQLRMALEDEEDCAIGEAIIGNIDDDGYLTSSVEEITRSLKEAHLLDQLRESVDSELDFVIGETIIKNTNDGTAIIEIEDIIEQLREAYLPWQLREALDSEKDHAIGEAIIENIDENSSLTTDIAELTESLKCEIEDIERILKVIKSFEPPECDPEDVERILKVIKGFEPLECETENVEQILQLIQTFDPAGVGARDLKECLLIQLEQLGLADTVAYRIVEEDYLQDLEANRFPQIAKSLKVDLELVRAAADAISCLEPTPGRQYNSARPEYIDPEVTVEEFDGEYRVFMNDSGPKIRLSPLYRRMLSSRDSLSSEEREYIRENMNSARWLIESIESRRITILRVTESIFEVQREFLDKGPAYLKPLTLKDIAGRVNVHESTVSRVTKNRYVQTPRGVFELKYFFTSSITTEGGGTRSSLSVKEMIKDMVDKEDSKKPLSDKDIELQLKQKGLKIARRTIAKYRDELNIPNSSKRKQW